MIIDSAIPFDEAIAIARQKGVLPSNLSSAQLAQLSAQLKRRAVFSARMDKAQVLDVLAKNLEQLVGNQKIEEENGRYRSVAEAKAQLKEALYRAGVPLAEAGTPTIKDFYSDTRRDLMVRTTLLDTLGFGRHVAGQDPIALDLNPAMELVRVVVPKGGEAAERDWIERWGAAMEDIGSDAEEGCTDPDEAEGRMVALVNHPIWQALGDGAGGYEDTLGNPWAPFAFNSGMNTIAVSRADAVELGIIDEDQQLEPDDDFDMNENLEASVAKFSSALTSELAVSGLELIKGVLRVANSRGESRQIIATFQRRAAINSLLNHLQEAA